MRVAGFFVSSAAFLLTAFPAQAQQEQGLSEEMRAEIRKIIREEVRSALREHHEERGEHRGGSFVWHGDGEHGHGKRLLARANKAIAEAHGDFLIDLEDGAKARFHSRDGKTHKTRAFSIPGGKGKVHFLHGDDDMEVDVDVRVETDDDGGKVHVIRKGDGKTIQIKSDGDIVLDGKKLELFGEDGDGHDLRIIRKGDGKTFKLESGGNIVFGSKKHDWSHEDGDDHDVHVIRRAGGNTFKLESGGNIVLDGKKIEWSGKDGDEVKSFSFPGGKGKVMFRRSGGKSSGGDENCCGGSGCGGGSCCESKAKAECPHLIEVKAKAHCDDGCTILV